MGKYLPDGNCSFLLRNNLLISNHLFILLCKYFLCDKFGLLIVYIFEIMPSQNHDYNTRTKEATIVTDTLLKIKRMKL